MVIEGCQYRRMGICNYGGWSSRRLQSQGV